jgi:hypothetical protein
MATRGLPPSVGMGIGEGLAPDGDVGDTVSLRLLAIFVVGGVSALGASLPALLRQRLEVGGCGDTMRRIIEMKQDYRPPLPPVLTHSPTLFFPTDW